MVLFLLLGGLAFGVCQSEKIEHKGKRVKATYEITTRHEQFQKKAVGATKIVLLQLETALSYAEDTKDEKFAEELLDDTLGTLSKLSRESFEKIKKKDSGGRGTTASAATIAGSAITKYPVIDFGSGGTMLGPDDYLRKALPRAAERERKIKKLKGHLEQAQKIAEWLAKQ